MNRTLRWIIGILALLLVVAVIAGAAWAWQHRAQLRANNAPFATRPYVPGYRNQPNGPFGFGDNNRGPRNGERLRGFGARAGLGLFGFGLFLMRTFYLAEVPLILLVLVAVFFYALGRRSRDRHPVTERPRSDNNLPK